MDWLRRLLELGLPALASGFVYAAGSALSVGPNNMMLLREGLTGGRVRATLAAVLGSYFGLLAVAALAADGLTTVGPPLRATASWAGLVALVWFAGLSLRSALRGSAHAVQFEAGGESLAACLRRVLAVVWLNPLTYIELLLLPAVLCGTFKTPETRTAFVAGLCLGEILSCCGYCFCGRVMAPLVRQRRAMQIVDLISGIVLARAAAIVAVELTLSWPVGGLTAVFQPAPALAAYRLPLPVARAVPGLRCGGLGGCEGVPVLRGRVGGGGLL